MNRIAMTCLALALLLAGCSSSKTQESAASAKQYQLRGEIMSLDPSGHVATIKHEEIKGFMGAMTMGYPIKDPAEFSKLTVGEPITATVYVSGDDMWVGNIQKDSGKDSGTAKQP
ncbi:MAG: copper-binding protein [Bryobacteraceae bacterium]